MKFVQAKPTGIRSEIEANYSTYSLHLSLFWFTKNLFCFQKSTLWNVCWWKLNHVCQLKLGLVTHVKDVLIWCFNLLSGDILLVFYSNPQDIALIQIQNIFVPGSADPSDSWHSCKLDISNCSPDQLSKMQGKPFLISIAHL